MKRITTFLLGIFILTYSYSQESLFRDTKYLMDLEFSTKNLICDTIAVNSPNQSQLLIHCHNFDDTTVLKVETIFNYKASLKSSIYIRTEYFDAENRPLAWTHRSFDSGIVLAGEINYYDANKLLETFKWGSGEIGLRTKYFYNHTGNLVKAVDYRGNLIIRTRTY